MNFRPIKAMFFAVIVFFLSVDVFPQKVGFISSETIRQNFSEAKAAEQRVQSIVEEWRREIAAMKMQIDNLEFEIRKNRLIWTDTERSMKEQELRELIKNREDYAKAKFEPGGEYDQVVTEIMRPIESKIFAAVQEVSASDGYDIIWDQSTQPLSYVNFKYDLTVKILRRLGVDVTKLQEELDQKIKTDPRNEPKDTPERPRRRSRTQRQPTATDTQAEPDEGEPADINREEMEKREKEREIERNR